jgi:hypothetical protein
VGARWVQVGAWLGKTTLFLRERAPKALVFVVEEWDNEAYKVINQLLL